MKGLDTNVLIRYLAQDDPRQSRAASKLVEALTPEDPGLITSVVLAEIIWVMEDLYGASRERVAEIVGQLLETRALVVQDSEIAWRALSRFKAGAADFSDYLIERSCAELGCDSTFTFDKRAARSADCAMVLLG